jgi:DNA-3-methyladenine glycosylase II
MPVTRSAARAATGVVAKIETAAKAFASSTTKKRKAEVVEKTTVKKQRASKKTTEKATQDSEKINQAQQPVAPNASLTLTSSAPTFLPAKLSFSFHEAKTHLISADPRFEDVFNKMKCRPYEHLERIDPFR